MSERPYLVDEPICESNELAEAKKRIAELEHTLLLCTCNHPEGCGQTGGYRCAVGCPVAKVLGIQTDEKTS